MELECPVCGALIELDEEEIEVGEEIECPECGALLVVVKRGRKMYLKPAEEEEEEEYVEDEDEIDWEEVEEEEEETF